MRQSACLFAILLALTACGATARPAAVPPTKPPPAPLAGAAMSFARGVLAYAASDGLVLLPPAGTPRRLGAGPILSVALSPDAKRVAWVATGRQGFVLHVADREGHALLTRPTAGGLAAFTADGRFVLFQPGEDATAALDLKSRRTLPLPGDNPYPVGGDRVDVATPSGIVQVDLATGRTVTLPGTRGYLPGLATSAGLYLDPAPVSSPPLGGSPALLTSAGPRPLPLPEGLRRQATGAWVLAAKDGVVAVSVTVGTGQPELAVYRAADGRLLAVGPLPLAAAWRGGRLLVLTAGGATPAVVAYDTRTWRVVGRVPVLGSNWATTGDGVVVLMAVHGAPCLVRLSPDLRGTAILRRL